MAFDILPDFRLFFSRGPSKRRGQDPEMLIPHDPPEPAENRLKRAYLSTLLDRGVLMAIHILRM